MSTSTQPFLRDFNNFLEINFGVLAPAIRTAPIIKSLFIASFSIVLCEDITHLILLFKILLSSSNLSLFYQE